MCNSGIPFEAYHHSYNSLLMERMLLDIHSIPVFIPKAHSEYHEQPVDLGLRTQFHTRVNCRTVFHGYH